MIPVVGGVGAAVLAALLVWVAAPARLGLRRARNLRRDARRLDQMSRSDAEHPGAKDRDPREATVIRDAERALAQARDEARAIVADAEARAATIVADAGQAGRTQVATAREAAGRAAEEIKQDAKRSARSIIREAQEKAQGILDAADLQLAEAERRAAHNQELAEQTQRELTALLHKLLEEARRGPGVRAVNVYPLGETQTRARRPDQTG